VDATGENVPKPINTVVFMRFSIFYKAGRFWKNLRDIISLEKSFFAKIDISN
jgi:hypothetical protein